MDQQNCESSILFENYHITMIEHIGDSDKVLNSIPRNLITHNIVKAAIAKNGSAIKFAPTHLLSDDIIMAALTTTQNSDALKHIVKFADLIKIPDDVFIEAVKQNGNLLSYVPDDRKIYEICKLAVSGDNAYDAICYVPQDKKTDEIIDIVINKYVKVLDHLATVEQVVMANTHESQYDAPTNDDIDMAFSFEAQLNDFSTVYCKIMKHIPLCKMTDDIITNTIRYAGNAIKYIPDDKKTDEIIKMALNINHYQPRHLFCPLRYVPHDKMTNYIVQLAATHNMLKYVPNDKITDDIIKMAIKYRSSVLEYISDDKKTDDVIKAAIAQYDYPILRYIPNDKKTDEIIKAAIRKNGGSVLEFVPDDKKTDEIIKMAITYNGLALKFVPNDKKTDEIIRMAVTCHGLALEFVPDDKKTDEIIKIATMRRKLNNSKITSISTVFKYVPKHMITSEMLSNDPCLVLQYCNNDMITDEIIEKAIAVNVNMLKYVPVHKITPHIIAKASYDTHKTIEIINNMYNNNIIDYETLCSLLSPNNIYKHLSCYYYEKTYDEMKTIVTSQLTDPDNIQSIQHNCIICNSSDELLSVHNHVYCMGCFKEWFCVSHAFAFKAKKCVICNVEFNINDVKYLI